EVKNELGDAERTLAKYEKGIETELELKYVNAVIEVATSCGTLTPYWSSLSAICADLKIDKDEELKIPPSLKNDYKAYGCDDANDSNALAGWHQLFSASNKVGAVASNICDGRTQYTKDAYDGPLGNTSVAEGYRK